MGVEQYCGPGCAGSVTVAGIKMLECNICAGPYQKTHAYTCPECSYTSCQMCYVRTLTDPMLARCPGRVILPGDKLGVGTACTMQLDLAIFLSNVAVLSRAAEHVLAEHFGKLRALGARQMAIANPLWAEEYEAAGVVARPPQQAAAGPPRDRPAREPDSSSDSDTPTARRAGRAWKPPVKAPDFLDTGAPLVHATYDNLQSRTDVRVLYEKTWERARPARQRLVDTPEPAPAAPAAPAEPAGPVAPLPAETLKDLEMAREAGLACQACPKCLAIISRVSGCSQMCVLCHTKFDYKTREIITGFFHNPHFFEYMAPLPGQPRRGRDRTGAVWFDEFLLACLEKINPTGGMPFQAPSWEIFCRASYTEARRIISLQIWRGNFEAIRVGIETLTPPQAIERLRAAHERLTTHRRLYNGRAVLTAMVRAAHLLLCFHPDVPLGLQDSELEPPQRLLRITRYTYSSIPPTHEEKAARARIAAECLEDLEDLGNYLKNGLISIRAGATERSGRRAIVSGENTARETY
jgi:hypothetical protein